MGFSDYEADSLCWEFARYVLPRLKYMKKNFYGYPPQFRKPEDWEAVLDKMITAFGLISTHQEDDLNPQSKTYMQTKPEVTEGLNLFAEYYLYLWH